MCHFEKFVHEWRQVQSARNCVIPRELCKTMAPLLLSSIDSTCASKIWCHSDSPFMEIRIRCVVVERFVHEWRQFQSANIASSQENS